MNTGKVRYAFRNLPIVAIHKQAAKAAEAAECAGDQGKFWEMHDRLFANMQKLMPADLAGHAGVLGLSAPAFQQCLDGGKYASKVQQDLADGRAAGVTSTPMFFLGPTTPNNGPVRVSASIKGAKPYSAFKEAIDKLLTERPDRP